jgi:hypothetical protein
MSHLYMELLCPNATEKLIYDGIFPDGRGLWEIEELHAYLIVAGNVDDKYYIQDSRGLLPKWYISDAKPLPINGIEEKHYLTTTLMEIVFKEVPNGILIRFISREGAINPSISQFVEKFKNRLAQIASFSILPPQIENDLRQKQLQRWEELRRVSYNEKLVELCRKDYTYGEIGNQLGKASKTISHKVGDLRKECGSEIVPFRRKKNRKT